MLLENSGGLADFNALVGAESQADGVNYDTYGAGDQICANSNINGNPAPDYDEVNTGLVYPQIAATRCRNWAAVPCIRKVLN